MEYIYMHLQVE